MKTLLTIAALTLTLNATANCTLNLQVKKSGAKTAYLNGNSVSKSMIEKLSSACKINVSVMSEDEKNAMTIKMLEKRLAKLKG